MLGSRATVFRSQALPDDLAASVRDRLVALTAEQPFSPLDARDAVSRLGRGLAGLGVPTTVYRGALDLRGTEVDHLWLDLEGHVVDVAFPLFLTDFVDALRAFVAGDADAHDLVRAAAAARLEDLVLGQFPTTLRYLGAPVWSARSVGAGGAG